MKLRVFLYGELFFSTFIGSVIYDSFMENEIGIAVKQFLWNIPI